MGMLGNDGDGRGSMVDRVLSILLVAVAVLLVAAFASLFGVHLM